MRQELVEEYFVDNNGNPAGGYTKGTGISIDWQNGPLVNSDGTKKQPTGAFVEGVIQAAIRRLMHYQYSKFACYENEKALEYLNHSLVVLDIRTKYRENRGVEGTHKT